MNTSTTAIPLNPKDFIIYIEPDSVTYAAAYHRGELFSRGVPQFVRKSVLDALGVATVSSGAFLVNGDPLPTLREVHANANAIEVRFRAIAEHRATIKKCQDLIDAIESGA